MPAAVWQDFRGSDSLIYDVGCRGLFAHAVHQNNWNHCNLPVFHAVYGCREETEEMPGRLEAVLFRMLKI